MKKLKIFIISGEASGDLLGAEIIKALAAQKSHEIELIGVGGEQLTNLGIKNIFPQDELAIMGFAEVLPRIPQILKRIKQTVQAIKKYQPDIILTIDAPDFNFRVIKKLRKSGYNSSKIVHLVAPTVWAYREYRAEKIAKLYDLLFCLLPFEPPYFEKYGLKSIFIGHPLLYKEIPAPALAPEQKYQINKKDKIILVTAGSRSNEISALSDSYIKALKQLTNKYNDLILVFPTHAKHRTKLSNLTEDLDCRIIITDDEAEKYYFMKHAYCALAKSGTNNLEIAAAGTALICCYKMSKLTYQILKRIIKIKYANLINILAGKEIIPELIQDGCTRENIFKQLDKYLSDKKYCENQVAAQNKYLEKFKSTSSTPAKLAADALLEDMPINIK